MYEDLTQKQIEILLYIKSEVQRQGYPPSVRDICKGVNLKSTSTVHSHLEKLEAKGYIRRDATKPRAIEILDRNDDFLLTPKNSRCTYIGESHCRCTYTGNRKYRRYLPYSS